MHTFKARCTTAIQVFVLLLLIGTVGCTSAVQREDSFVLVDAVIYTADEAMPIAEAMAVVEGKVALVGHEDEVLAAYPDLTLKSAGGRAVLPGFTDSHAHFMGLGEEKLMVDLRGTRDMNEVISRIQTFAETLPEGSWIVGRGWNQVLWPGQLFPTKGDLDKAFPDTPIWLRRVDGHAAWANTAALELAGLDAIRAAEDPDGGAIIRDASGEPTGVFIDNAMYMVEAVVPPYTEEHLDRALELALQEAAEMGLTGIHDAGVDMSTIDRYKRFIDEDRFSVRMYAMVSGLGSTFDAFCNNPILDYGDKLTVRSVKLYLDGALGSRGAALIDDYSDDPGNRGLIRMSVEDFNDAVKLALECGYQINTHAIGDRGNQVLFDGYEMAGITPEGRHRNEHTQIIDLGDIPRFKEMGIIASMQPTHATSDLNMAEDRLGPHRIKGGYAWRTIADAGIPIAFGSDFPVEKSNPIEGFFAGVTRQTKDLLPEGGWYPEERLTREETLKAFTEGAAFAAFQEDKLGSLSPGKFADFIVLSGDIMTVPSPQILDSKVMATFLGGKAIYGSLD
jgi:predicted amidohydrolase YtcJ